MRSWMTFASLFVLCLMAAYAAKIFLRKAAPVSKRIVQTPPKTPKIAPAAPDGKKRENPAAPPADFSDNKALTVSDDEDSKQHDYWIEQVFEITQAVQQLSLIHI